MSIRKNTTKKLLINQKFFCSKILWLFEGRIDSKHLSRRPLCPIDVSYGEDDTIVPSLGEDMIYLVSLADRCIISKIPDILIDLSSGSISRERHS